MSSIEVRDNSWLKDSELICELLFMQKELLCGCFGADFYAQLEADLNVVEAAAWQERLYKRGELVYDEGYYYESLVDSNREAPLGSACWQPVDKFKTACYNWLWKELKVWLAYEIAIAAIPSLSYRIGQNGVQQNVDHQTLSERASVANLSYATQIRREHNEQRLQRIDRWIAQSDCCLPRVQCCPSNFYTVWREESAGW